jgi:hypothetical protein
MSNERFGMFCGIPDNTTRNVHDGREQLAFVDSTATREGSENQHGIDERTLHSFTGIKRFVLGTL